MSEPGAQGLVPFLVHLHEITAEADASWRAGIGDAPRDAPEAASAALILATDAVTPAALTLYNVDREMRRAVRLVESGYRTKKAHKSVAGAFAPLPLGDGHLSIASTETGSLEIVFVVVGALAQALLSEPVQLAVTTRELLGWAGRVIVTVRRPFERNGNIVYSDSAPLDLVVDDQGIRVSSLPSGARLRIEHKLRDGTETTIELDRF